MTVNMRSALNFLPATTQHHKGNGISLSALLRFVPLIVQSVAVVVIQWRIPSCHFHLMAAIIEEVAYGTTTSRRCGDNYRVQERREQ